MEQDEKDIVLAAMMEYLCLVNEVMEAYLNGEASISSLEELSKGMKNILESFEEVE